MYRYVFKRVKDFRKSFACQQKLNTQSQNEPNKQQTSIQRFEVNYLVPNLRINYDDFKRKYNCKHPNSCNPFLHAITWSTALIAGFYASQLVCLYRRNHRIDPKKCFYARYFQYKNKLLHRKLLFAKYARTQEKTAVAPSVKYACPFKKKKSEQKSTQVQNKQTEKSNEDELKDFFNEFTRLNLFDKRFEKFVRVDDDDLTFGSRRVFYNVNDSSNISKSKEKSTDNVVASEVIQKSDLNQKIQQEVEDESINDIMTNLSDMIGELEFELGVQCVLQGHYHEAIEHFRMSSASNNASACFNLALLYEQGLGVEKDLKIAMQLYKMASDQGHDKAQYNLGVYFARGLGGVKKNFKKAKMYFEKAAMHGNLDAIEALSLALPEKKKLSSSLLVDPDSFMLSDDSGTGMTIKDFSHHKSIQAIAVT